MFWVPMFYVILFVNLVFQWVFDTFLATIVDYGTQRGLTVENVVVIIGCYSVSDLIGLFPFYFRMLLDCSATTDVSYHAH